MRVAISIPNALLRAADRAARRQRVSRSRFYSDAVAAYLKSQRQKSGSQGEKGIKEALDAVYGSEPSEPDPFVTAAAYHLLAKEKW
jgi:metal-responsive CopG/Arc/MetJ family transcriptional regulator